MTHCDKRYKVAAIDLGTVSSRLVLAQVEGGAIVESSKHTEITDLGEGVDATGRFCEAAVERVLAACRMFVDEARAFGAVCICTTCTSAARDASNAALLLDGLRELSLDQVSAAIERMSALDVAGIAALPGVQPKRAGVILAGAAVIRELMRAGGYKTLTVSENSLLAGMAATINEVLDGATPTIGWTPSLSAL